MEAMLSCQIVQFTNPLQNRIHNMHKLRLKRAAIVFVIFIQGYCLCAGLVSQQQRSLDDGDIQNETIYNNEILGMINNTTNDAMVSGNISDMINIDEVGKFDQ